MNDSQVDTDPAVLAEASQMGWVPEERFKGDKARWVDAATFVERGHTVLPILQKNNKELLSRLEAAQADVATTKETVRTLSQSLKDMAALQAAEVKRQVEEKVALVRAQLREARRGDDPELTDALEDRLEVEKERLAELKKPTATPPPPAPPQAPALEPWAVEFRDANAAWFGVDKKRTAVFAAAADEAYAEGLRGPAMAARAKEAMLEIFEPKAPGVDKAEGGGRGGGGPGGGKSGWDALPAEAKAFCLSEAHKFVGPKGKAFKTEAEWKAHYAKTYLAS